MWFFQKKKEDKDISKLHSSLKDSFTKIREDMNHLGKWTAHFKEKHNTHDKQFEHHTRRLDVMEAKVDTILQMLDRANPIESKTAELSLMDEAPEPSQEDELELITSNTNVIDNLTNLQKTFLAQLFTLQKESSQKWVSMKYLAQEIYPTKDYQTIRSMISTYTEILLELGLIEKRRKGRDTYVSLTKKANAHLDKKKKAIKVKNA
jgi:hypothetical protein